MAYNNLNKLRLWAKVIDIVNENYVDGITTYAGIWRQNVNPVYPMSYDTFMKIINTPNLKRLLSEAEKEKINKSEKND